MKKYLVETYYTCTFKTVHSLNNLNDQELAKIDTRTDGEVEVIDVKLNNRKTKKIGDEKSNKKMESKITEPISNNLSEKIANTNKIQTKELGGNLKMKNQARLKCLIEEKDTFKKLK